MPAQCDGTSLLPQIRYPQAPRVRPAITCHVDDSIYVLKADGQMKKERTPDAQAKGIAASHAVRDDQYRYIHYYNGFEELCDVTADPNEYTNRTADPAYVAIKRRLAQMLPSKPAWPVAVPRDSKLSTKDPRNPPTPSAK